MLSNQTLPVDRCPLTVTGSAIWLLRRFTLSRWEVEGLLLEREFITFRSCHASSLDIICGDC